SAASIIASVASTSCVSSSYSASSHTNWKTSPASPGRAGRMDSIRLCSHRHRGFDVRMRLVAFEREILVAECEQVLHRRIELHHRERLGRTRELQVRLLQVI